MPTTLAEGARRLAEVSGVAPEACAARLREMLLLGNQAPLPDGNNAFAFKLHQFISQGGSVYATLERPEKRLLTLEGQFYAPGGGDRLLYPLQFCRVCGQEYYTAYWQKDGHRLLPLPEGGTGNEEDDTGAGYVMPDQEGRWQDETSALPEHWFEPAKPDRAQEGLRGLPSSAVVRQGEWRIGR